MISICSSSSPPVSSLRRIINSNFPAPPGRRRWRPPVGRGSSSHPTSSLPLGPLPRAFVQFRRDPSVMCIRYGTHSPHDDPQDACYGTVSGFVVIVEFPSQSDSDTHLLDCYGQLHYQHHVTDFQRLGKSRRHVTANLSY